MEKKHLRYSHLKEYVTCPKRFDLATQYEPVFGKSTEPIIRDGSIFERYVLGDFDNSLAELEGKKRPHTLKAIEMIATHVAENHIAEVENVQYELRHEDENFIIECHPDFLGTVPFKQELVRGQVDLKYTGKIDFVWDEKLEKWDYLQGALYSYVWWKNYNEILPFIYLAVESSNPAKPYVRPIKLTCTEDSFAWIEELCNTVATVPFLEARANEYNCLGMGRTARCPWLTHCDEGRALLEHGVDLDFDMIP